MNKFSKMQYKLDADYISENYIRKVNKITDEENIVNNYKMSYVEYQDELYAMYKIRLSDRYGLLLMPMKENILESDFSDIIFFYANEEGISLSTLKRENEMVSAEQYDFGFSNNGFVFSKLHKYESDDTNKDVLANYLKSGLSLEDFIISSNYLLTLEAKSVTYVKRDDKKTVGYSIDDLETMSTMDTMEDGYNFYLGYDNQNIMDNDIALIELHKELISNKQKVK